MLIPEEISRIVAERVSRLLFCPTDAAVENLASEGVTTGVQNVGDVMYGDVLFYDVRAKRKSRLDRELGLSEKGIVLATINRQENIDYSKRIIGIVEVLAQISGDLPKVQEF